MEAGKQAGRAEWNKEVRVVCMRKTTKTESCDVVRLSAREGSIGISGG